MPLFHVAVREHAYTGLFYGDVVEAGSGEEALQPAAERATAPRPPPGPGPQRGSDVVVREHAYPGRSMTTSWRPGPAKRRCNPRPSGPPRPGRRLVPGRSEGPTSW